MRTSSFAACTPAEPTVKTAPRNSKRTCPWTRFASSRLMPRMLTSAWGVWPTTCSQAFGRPCRPLLGGTGRLWAVRDFAFLVGADLIPRGRRLDIRLAVPREERPAFLTRLRTLSEGLPIVAQWNGREPMRKPPTKHPVKPDHPLSGPVPPWLLPLNPHHSDFLLRNPGQKETKRNQAPFLK